MRYATIQIEGRPEHSATLTRPGGGEFVEVTLATPAGSRTHRVRADDREDLWSMAEILQHALDGFRGAGGDIREHFHALEHLAAL